MALLPQLLQEHLPRHRRTSFKNFVDRPHQLWIELLRSHVVHPLPRNLSWNLGFGDSVLEVTHLSRVPLCRSNPFQSIWTDLVLDVVSEEAERVERTPEEQEILDEHAEEKGRDRTEEEAELALAQARSVGELEEADHPTMSPDRARELLREGKAEIHETKEGAPETVRTSEGRIFQIAWEELYEETNRTSPHLDPDNYK